MIASSSPQRLLALESATDSLSVAFLDGERIVAIREHESVRQHAAVLLSVVDETLRQAGAALGDLDALAISAGPGSFTSLRIGLATLKGLAFGRNLPVIGVSTLEAMALGALEGGTDWGADAEILTLLDARRGEWYAGAWRGAIPVGGVPTMSLAEGLYSPPQLATDLARAVIAVSPETSGWPEVFERAGLCFTARVTGERARPRADWVGRLGARRLARGEGQSASSLTARYLRRAEAEARRTGRAVEEGETERIGPAEAG